MEFDNSRPIWIQLAEEIRRRVAAGEWPPGERVPGVRGLALEVGVNPNTVQRTFAELEHEGLVYTERTTGRFVTSDTELVNDLKRRLAANAATQFAAAARGLTLSLEEATQLLHERWNEHD